MAQPKTAVLKEIAWVIGGHLLSALGLLAGVRLLTEYVNPDVMGRVSLFLGMMNLALGTLWTPSVLAILRFFPDAQRQSAIFELRRIMDRRLIRHVGTLTILTILASIVFYACFGGSMWTVIALSVLAMFQAKLKMETFFLTAARRQKLYSIITLVETISQPLVAVIFVLIAGATPASILGGYAAAEATVLASVLWWVNRDGMHEPASPTPSGLLESQIYQYTAPLIPLAALGWLTGMSDRYFIAGFVSAQAVGIYSIGYSFVSRVFILSQQVFEVNLRPPLFDAASHGDRHRETRVLQLWTASTAAASLAIALFIWAFGDLLAGFLFSAEYQDAADLLPWLALGYCFLNLANVLEAYCQACKRPALVTAIRCGGAVGSIVVGAPFIWQFGLMGAAIATPVYMGSQLALAAVLMWPLLMERRRSRKEILHLLPAVPVTAMQRVSH